MRIRRPDESPTPAAAAGEQPPQQPSPGVPPEGGQAAALGPDDPMFAPPKMEAITADRGAEDARTLDQP